jgi:hypothetical protein
MGERAMTDTARTGYRPTEAKYKGGAHERYVTYDLEQRTRGGQHALYPKVRRVYIAGELKDWRAGAIEKRTGRRVHGVRIEYEQRRRGYRRRSFAAHRGATDYTVGEASVGPTAQRFVQVVEVPERARNVHFYADHGELPPRYREALQRIR